MTHIVTAMSGDGIGPEVMAATMAVVDATGASLLWDHQPIGLSALEWNKELIPKQTVLSMEKNKIGLKGPTGTPVGGGHRSINVTLRERFDLYANVRPTKNINGVKTRFDGVDIVLFRENLEDLYVGEERYVDAEEKVAEAISRITWDESVRVARYAFLFARKHGRRKITVGHKANILKKTHGLWLRAIDSVRTEYPEIAYETMIMDALNMQLVTRPERFDCLLLPNLFGDLTSDLCAGLVGGLGFAPGANIGNEFAIFEAVHGTAPDIAGKGIANPTALILSAAMMLDHLGETLAGDRIRHAVEAVLAEGRAVTGDVNPVHPVSTLNYAHAVIAKL